VNYLPFFEQLLSKLAEFMNSGDPSSSQWALCIFCDLIEFAGPASLNYQQHFLQQMGQSLSSSSADLRQASSYGVGVAAKFGGPNYTEFCIASLPHLVNMINSPEAKHEENLLATENAIAALGKIISTYKDSGRFDTNALITSFVASLPITEDSEEAPETYMLLLDLIEAQHPIVANQSQIPQLVRILTSVLCIPSLLAKNPELLQKMQTCLRSIIGSCNEALKQHLWQTLTDEQKQYLANQQLIR
jgi:importin-5